MNAEFIYPLRVHIEDTDYAGVVYHANYLKYFERARSEWMEQLGFGTAWQQQEALYFPIRHVEVDYLKPARLHQLVEVVTRIAERRKASVVFEQHLRLQAHPLTIFCTAKIKVACVDKELRPRAWPECVIITSQSF